MEEIYARHQQYPYVYEEQSMVMLDRNGKRDTRKAMRYSRVEEDGTAKILFLFHYPREVKGVALLATRDTSGKTKKYIYLPAFGEQLIESIGGSNGGNFLGTDFSIENLTGEVLSNYRYDRLQDTKINENKYFLIDVYRGTDATTTRPIRRHFIRQDNYFITRTDHFDKQGRLQKLQTHHDLKPLGGDMWRSNMIQMEDKKAFHKTLIKIDRRVFSHDYVPAEMFTAAWLYKNYPAIKLIDLSDDENDSGNEESHLDPEDQMSRIATNL